MGILSRMQHSDDEGDEPEGSNTLRGLRATSSADIGPLSAEHLQAIKRRVQNELLAEVRRAKELERKARDTGRLKADRERDRRAREEQAHRKDTYSLLPTTNEQLWERITELFSLIVAEQDLVLSRRDRQAILEAIYADVVGLGPLEALLKDETINDIMVVGADTVFVERAGQLVRTGITFESDAHVQHVIDRIIAPLGRRVDEMVPMMDARLPDGSRVNVVVPPLVLNGSCITIRKFAVEPFTVADLVANGTAPALVFEFLAAIVASRVNVLVSGASASGKTTLLNVLSGFIPADERLVTIENAAELQLRQPHVVRLESRPPNIEGEGKLTIRDLVINALRMRPDRIIVGEVRSDEAIDLLQAMTTGHEGSMGTIHANSTADALSRLETMVLTGDLRMPSHSIREQIASAIDIIVHMVRLRDGQRRMQTISQVEGMEGNNLVVTDLFTWERLGMDADGKVMGRMTPTGIQPRALQRIIDAGLYIPPSVFGLTDYDEDINATLKDFNVGPAAGGPA
jgi:pilus assembly protein CpaF